MNSSESQTQSASLHPFYPLVDSAASLAVILPAGVRLAQLRIKNATDQALLAEIDEARMLCEQAGCTLVINDHWRAAIETGCRYVHLGQEDLDDADLTALRVAGVQFGISTHDDDELTRALAARPDYIALGPIFPTASKQLDWAAQGLERLAVWRQKIGSLPLVAIGGLSLETAARTLDAGADALAVIGDVMNHADPAARSRQWLQLLADRQP